MIHSEAPDDTGRCAVIVLGSAQVMGVHVVALQAPGKILKTEPVVSASTYVDHERVIDKSARIQVADAGHAVNKRPPPVQIGGEPQATEGVILGHAGAIETRSEERRVGKECR